MQVVKDTIDHKGMINELLGQPGKPEGTGRKSLMFRQSMGVEKT
jgi:hypothetical protein